MLDFFKESIFWLFAIYGFIEIVKTIKYSITYAKFKNDKMYFILAMKNQENKVEGIVRSILFRILYGKEETIKNLIIVDLNSIDNTFEIATKLEKEYDNIKVVKWEECKELLEDINK